MMIPSHQMTSCAAFHLDHTCRNWALYSVLLSPVCCTELIAGRVCGVRKIEHFKVCYEEHNEVISGFITCFLIVLKKKQNALKLLAYKGRARAVERQDRGTGPPGLLLRCSN